VEPTHRPTAAIERRQQDSSLPPPRASGHPGRSYSVRQLCSDGIASGRKHRWSYVADRRQGLGVDPRLPELSLQIRNAIQLTGGLLPAGSSSGGSPNRDRGSLADRIAGGTKLSGPLVDDVAVHTDDGKLPAFAASGQPLLAVSRFCRPSATKHRQFDRRRQPHLAGRPGTLKTGSAERTHLIGSRPVRHPSIGVPAAYARP
jgi:hypothetical protein